MGQKKCLLQQDVPNRQVPQWPQLSVKVVYPKVLLQCPDVLEYLPDEEDNCHGLPPREFFFAVLSAIRADEVDEMIRQAAQERAPQQMNLQEQKWQVAISDEWMEKLLQYDYISSMCHFPHPLH